VLQTAAKLLASTEPRQQRIQQMLEEHTLGGDAGNLLARDFPLGLLEAMRQHTVCERRVYAALSLLTPVIVDSDDYQSEDEAMVAAISAPLPSMLAAPAPPNRQHEEEPSRATADLEPPWQAAAQASQLPLHRAESAALAVQEGQRDKRAREGDVEGLDIFGNTRARPGSPPGKLGDLGDSE
jgi:hypothetical protein